MTDAPPLPVVQALDQGSALLALAARVEAALPQENSNEWQDHDGGGRPHKASSFVEAEFRSGDTLATSSAMLMWPWSDCDEDSDIIRWRFAPEPMSRVRAGDILIENAATIAAALRAHASQAPLLAQLEEMREALTPSGDTKAAYMGEFAFNLTQVDEFGDERQVKTYVPWTTIKEIMAAILTRANGGAK